MIYLLGKLSREADAEEVWNKVQDPAIKALMLEPDLLQDSYLSDKIIRSLNKKIRQAYIGKLIVKGKFQFLIFDPYALTEYVFGMKPKGLLNEFEFYADNWSKQNVDYIAALRSPMTWRAEVNKLKLLHTEEMQKWYRYVPNCVILNMWGNDRDIFSSADADGDNLALTDNKTYLRCRYGGVPVLYEHKKAVKEFIEK